MNTTQQDIILQVKNLQVSFLNGDKTTEAVKDLSFDLRRGQRLGIVGESGSGKSVTSLSILNLLQSNKSNSTTGSIVYHSEEGRIDLLGVPMKRIYRIRGKKISMVFQEPMSALNPVRKCGIQVKEVLDVHDIGIAATRKKKVLEIFSEVALPEVERIYNSYPHELSGGQLQRVNVAMALATGPDIIICDEPTTALDVTVQKQIINLLKRLVASTNIALIFISHDLDVVSELCDSVVVMYQGEIVEYGPLPSTFSSPNHAYTKALMACKPTVHNRAFILPTVAAIMSHQYTQHPRPQLKINEDLNIISVKGLSVYFPVRATSFFSKKSFVKAVDDISFNLRDGEILGIVGESGSGKSTVANCVSGLLRPTSGTMRFRDKMISGAAFRQDKKLRTSIQLVFQDPYSSLNPKMTIGEAISEPLRYHKVVPEAKIKDKLNKLLEQVGLEISYRDRYPHQLSGGQRQRACIARALSVNPDVLICDESVSALDVSIQAQILNLLESLRTNLGLSIIFISHDLAVIHYICDYVLVMNNGEIVEEGAAEKIMLRPEKAYTKELINSLPVSIL